MKLFVEELHATTYLAFACLPPVPPASDLRFFFKEEIMPALASEGSLYSLVAWTKSRTMGK